jgi:hypothetical protein
MQVRRQQARQPKDLCGQRYEPRLSISSMQLKRVHRPLHPNTKSGISANLSSYGKFSVKVRVISSTISDFASRWTATLD